MEAAEGKLNKQATHLGESKAGVSGVCDLSVPEVSPPLPSGFVAELEDVTITLSLGDDVMVK